MLPFGRREKIWLSALSLMIIGLVTHLNNMRLEAIDESLHSVTTKKVAAERAPSSSASVSFEKSTDSLSPSPYNDAVKWGEKIITDTPSYARSYSGNQLSCSNCHLQGGRQPGAAPWIGIWGVFPEYRARSGRLNTLEERINDCFERSLNGRPLPDGSPEMMAILTYMHWLSEGVPTGLSVDGRGFQKLESSREPDPLQGKLLYEQKCAACHGANGQGQGQIGADHKVIFPPLWGTQSFNIGAGMARLNTAAAFIKANMPLGQGNTLTTEEAFDIAEYFIRQNRPDFRKKGLDWPKGGKPKDARY